MTHPAVRDLFHGAGRHPAFHQLTRAIAGQPGAALSLTGLTPSAKALYMALLWQASNRPVLWITDTPRTAETALETTGTFFDILVTGREPHRPFLVPAFDVTPGQNMSPHTDISEQRAIGLWRLAAGRASVVIAPAAAALVRHAHPGYYRQLALTLRAGDEIPLDDLIVHLAASGYRRREPVEMVGEFSLRGGIVDVFPAEAPQPVRIEMFGDSIESLRRFDAETQRSTLKLEDIRILPLTEFRVGASASPGWEFRTAEGPARDTALVSMLQNAIVVLDEPASIEVHARKLWERLEGDGELAGANYWRWEEFVESMTAVTLVHLRELEVAGESATSSFHIPARPTTAFHGNMQIAVAESRNHVEAGSRVAFFGATTGEVERLADILQQYSVPFQFGLAPSEGLPAYLAERSWIAGEVANTFLVKGRVARGFHLPEPGLAVFGTADLFDTSGLVPVAPRGRSALSAFAADIADLNPGDYVVHTTHGIGKYLGVREISQGDMTGDFMLLEYAGDAKLYVPLSRLDLVEKYRGAGDGAPSLDRLGGVTWNRTKTRVKAKMRDMAAELLKLYAERQLAEGFAFSAESNWQREFEDAFAFTETRDQLTSIAEIKRDMEKPQPMDRLLCGDVGFGKTEVAMRAAFKALGDGKQVAVLAPTTVLAFQHFETFRSRFAAFPVRVEMLSRFRSAKDVKQVLVDLADGKVDLVIGTHRILSKDVVFRDLGLLIVDEEQRFGVRHKERLKQLTTNVDVLTMSATPIPRTLHMSLVGLRDMSVIETPPKDRLAIHTVVAHFNDALIRAAIEQELSRGGQVYYIHNRIDSIWERAAHVQELVPQSRIGVGHGQMDESALEKVLLGFMRHDYDVFLSTTIVENGLDIPLANTMIIENAERYGLSELYQLRGRVGRSDRRAYAYLLVPPDTELSEIARKRLAALKEFSELGAGFKIAALDLELRGAGNLLGGEQHGHIGAVGFDTYLRLMEEAVQELKGQPVPVEVNTNLSLGLDLRIPPEYIADDHQRLRVYKKIAALKEQSDTDEVIAELTDRYGKPPAAIHTLVQFSLIKGLAQKTGVETVDRRGGMLNIKFHAESRVDPKRLMDLVHRTQAAQFTPACVLRLPTDGGQDAAGLLGFLEKTLAGLSG